MQRIEQLPPHEQIAMAIVGYHEGGQWQRNYAKVVYDLDDPGGLSVGWGQAALQTQERVLGSMMHAYIQRKGQYADQLSIWMPLLDALNTQAQGDTRLHALLRQMATDPLWRALQDEKFLGYLGRARSRWQARGLTTHLALGLWVDMEIQHGGDWLARWASDAMQGDGPQSRQDVLEKGVRDYYKGNWAGKEEWDSSNEMDIIYATLLMRTHYLMTGTSRSWPPSTYRCSHFLQLWEIKTTQFDWGMLFHTVHPGGQNIHMITSDLLIPS